MESLINLRKIKMDDYETVLAWSRNELFCSSNGWEQNRDEKEVYRWWEACVNTPLDDFVRKGIEYKHELIGYTDLAYIKDQTAELGIAIGASHYWGKGIGSEAGRRMMEYGLDEFGITIYYAETNEYNMASRRMLEKLGYKETGREGQEEYRGKEGQLIHYEYKVANYKNV
ncbi:GNAT family N-acetyltransferase [Paenibacillus lautus]|uniref:GNAT family N-acetyltransferase n=1 Tax=Paenibacillus lautus TaxID=1401 RepID=UPI002176BDDB|nr:GNAT family N-acetyltransferase [Paenibacillus lautus]